MERKRGSIQRGERGKQGGGRRFVRIRVWKGREKGKGDKVRAGILYGGGERCR